MAKLGPKTASEPLFNTVNLKSLNRRHRCHISPETPLSTCCRRGREKLKFVAWFAKPHTKLPGSTRNRSSVPRYPSVVPSNQE